MVQMLRFISVNNFLGLLGFGKDEYLHRLTVFNYAYFYSYKEQESNHKQEIMRMEVEYEKKV